MRSPSCRRVLGLLLWTGARSAQPLQVQNPSGVVTEGTVASTDACQWGVLRKIYIEISYGTYSLGVGMGSLESVRKRRSLILSLVGCFPWGG